MVPLLVCGATICSALRFARLNVPNTASNNPIRNAFMCTHGQEVAHRPVETLKKKSRLLDGSFSFNYSGRKGDFWLMNQTRSSRRPAGSRCQRGASDSKLVLTSAGVGSNVVGRESKELGVLTDGLERWREAPRAGLMSDQGAGSVPP